MDVSDLGIIVAVGLAAGGAWLAFGRKKGLRPASSRPVSYRCVGIQPADPVSSCEVARAMSGRRFLPGQAPHLPLSGCTAARCACKYVHFDDRRAGDRRSDLGQQVRKFHSLDWAERRSSRGRRKTDRRGMLTEAEMQAAIAQKRKRRGR
jgi:hypothetical protein